MKPTSKTLSWAFVIILLAVGIFTGLGVILMHKQPLVLQGQAEATEIRISGKLPGRIDTFFVQEGDWVHQGDTLVVINSPEVHAKYQQVNALEQVAVQQNKKIDAGTRRQIVATALQLWNKTKSDLTLAQTTYNRILTLYKDSVITSQRKDEVEAMYKAAVAAERAAYEQYQMAVDGAQKEDKASAASMVDAARSTVDEVSALLVDARLTAPENGQIATIFPKRGELVALIRSDGSKFNKEIIDVIEMVRSGDLTRNLNIRSDDLIYVERALRFYIYGEVQRPGTYRLERNMTVIQALSVGGGLTQRGTERGLRIQRRDAEGNLQMLTVKSSDLVEPDDVLYIKESLF